MLCAAGGKPRLPGNSDSGGSDGPDSWTAGVGHAESLGGELMKSELIRKAWGTGYVQPLYTASDT